MRHLLVITLLIIASLVAFNLGRHLPRRGVAPEDGSEAPRPRSHGAAVDSDSVRAARLAIRRRIAESDTYLQRMLADGDSVLKRWPQRIQQPLRVHVSRGTVPGFTPALAEAVRRAYVRWEQAGGIPVRFTFVRDSGRAEVHVRWIEAFPQRRSGQADVVWSQDGWLVKGTLTLATHTGTGRALSPEAVHTTALHEIGHLLGLGHSDDPADVMYPATTVHDLTPRDQRTGRLLYALPPGSVRDP